MVEESKYAKSCQDDNELLLSLGSSTLGRRSIQLVVCDLLTPDRLDVYFDTTKFSYPLGLMPGSHVTFRNLERCVSRKSKVYCRFESNSSVTVDKFPNLRSQMQYSVDSKEAVAEEFDINEMDNLPLKYLCHYLHENCDYKSVSKIHGHITFIQYVAFRYSCSTCGDLFQQGCCKNTKQNCDSTTGVFKAKASFLIDDGTYEANVFCNGDVVAMILGLSKTQCSSIHEVVYQTGEVSYTYQSNEYYNST
ncbi:CST complex subunit CTC1-like, partial [Saccoglossus kowalevskii]